MSGGTIQIDRALLDHPIVGYKTKYFKPWIWMLMEARWADGQKDVGGYVVKLKRGEFAHSLRFISRGTGLTVKEVRTFLSILERNGMGTKTGTVKGKEVTKVTICNYNKYQLEGQGKGTTKGKVRAQQGHKLEDQRISEKEKDIDKSISKKKKPIEELLEVLPEEIAQAVVDHRKSIRKPLTAYASKLLAGKFNKTGQPEAAAKMMIANGWQGFEVGWFQN
ncbi:MAG: hypothetical protein GY941_28865, partial [Planctomycetes bacterium]|nr:hypothetical protein [Planctomycetota bacterium]